MLLVPEYETGVPVSTPGILFGQPPRWHIWRALLILSKVSFLNYPQIHHNYQWILGGNNENTLVFPLLWSPGYISAIHTHGKIQIRKDLSCREIFHTFQGKKYDAKSVVLILHKTHVQYINPILYCNHIHFTQLSFSWVRPPEILCAILHWTLWNILAGQTEN